jgi:hypothetical protein
MLCCGHECKEASGDGKDMLIYFDAHRVRVLTNQPLNNIFGNRDSSGRIGK